MCLTVGVFKGPLSQYLKTSPKITPTEQYANIMIFAFAGHDTTGHTLTWLIYELAKNIDIQINRYKRLMATRGTSDPQGVVFPKCFFEERNMRVTAEYENVSKKRKRRILMFR